MSDDAAQLSRVLAWVTAFESDLASRPVACVNDPHPPPEDLPESGIGVAASIDRFEAEVAPHLSASPGPKYWGFVTGGVTPAALAADWLTSAVDQNVALPGDSIASAVEARALDWLLQLFSLPDAFSGVLTSGATSANLLGSLCARQYAGLRQSIDVARQGLHGVRTAVFSATPHASMVKGLGFAGFGRDNITTIRCRAGSEAMDIADLRLAMQRSANPGKIVIASAGTVTGTDYDDFDAVADLCAAHGAWLHVDAAFGLFAVLDPEKKPWLRGVERADSLTADCHKWLNVPYDSGVFFTRHEEILLDVCGVSAPYLTVSSDTPAFMNRGIENSRRFRALPIWLSLLAYGREGVREWVQDNCRQAEAFAAWINAAGAYELLTPCRLNVVFFRPTDADQATVARCLNDINSSGEVFMSPGLAKGRAGIRAAFSNWRTRTSDVEQICGLLDGLAPRYAG